jgi:hypothetical protein
MFSLFKRNALYVIYYQYTFINTEEYRIDGCGHCFYKAEKSLNSMNKLKRLQSNIEDGVNKENLCNNVSIVIVNIIRLN